MRMSLPIVLLAVLITAVSGCDSNSDSGLGDCPSDFGETIDFDRTVGAATNPPDDSRFRAQFGGDDTAGPAVALTGFGSFSPPVDVLRLYFEEASGRPLADTLIRFQLYLPPGSWGSLREGDDVVVDADYFRPGTLTQSGTGKVRLDRRSGDRVEVTFAACVGPSRIQPIRVPSRDVLRGSAHGTGAPSLVGVN